jgi:hypothetical protein
MVQRIVLWEAKDEVLGGWSAIRKLASFGRSPGHHYFASGATTPIFDVTRKLAVVAEAVDYTLV